MLPRLVGLLAWASAWVGISTAVDRRAVADEPRRKPSVILIVADDLGHAELGCYGQRKIRTPRIDRMAAEGLRFTRFYAGSPVCAPSRCSLLTGKHGGHAWIRDNREMPRPPSNDEFSGQVPLPDREFTLAELFRRRSYATAAIGKWGLGTPGSEGDPQRQGFDHFFGYYCQRHAHNHYPRYLYRDGKQVPLEGNPGGPVGRQYSHDLFESEALAFLDAQKERPFFLYLPVTVPHVAIQVPEDSLAEYRGQWDDPSYLGGKGYQPHPSPRAGYAAMVTRLDRTVGRILDRLRSLGRDRDTLVLFTSDNGPTHDGVGGSDSAFFESAGALRGLKGSVYEGGLRVPLIAWWPGTIRPGRVTERPGYFPDLLPTLQALLFAGDRIPDSVDGISLAPTLLGEPAKQRPHPPMYWEFAGYGGQQAVLVDEWKGLRRDILKGNRTIELYSLKQDPGERRDVAAEHPEVVARIASIMSKEHSDSGLFPMPAISGLGLNDRPGRPSNAETPGRLVKDVYGVGIVGNCCTHGAGLCAMFRARSDTKVVAAFESGPRRGRELQQAVGMPLSPSADAVINDPAVDILAIACDPCDKAAMVEKAARAGKAIFLNKPPCDSLDAARRIVDAVRTHRVWLVHDIPMIRSVPVFARLLDDMRRRPHGRVMGYHHLFGMNFDPSFDLKAAWPERLDSASKSGGGELTNMGCYAIDYAVTLLGRPRAVTAKWRKEWDVYRQADVEHFGQVLLDYGEFFALLEAGKQQLAGPSRHSNALTINFEHTTLSIDAGANQVAVNHVPQDWQQFVRGAAARNSVSQLLDALRNGVPPDPGVDTILDSTEVLMAAYESIVQDGRIVRLPLERGDNPLTRTTRNH
ncbi:MAG: sulfatase-like hydrolase/transferase [Isosphaeraceae bacterium]